MSKKEDPFKSKAEIAESGNLLVLRENKLVHMKCPWAGFENCGHHCPHFGDPVAIRKDPKPELRRPSQMNPNPKPVTLEEQLTWEIVGYGIELCFGKRLSWEELTDERK